MSLNSNSNFGHTTSKFGGHYMPVILREQLAVLKLVRGRPPQNDILLYIGCFLSSVTLLVILREQLTVTTVA
jgi:hypothetical protein